MVNQARAVNDRAEPPLHYQLAQVGISILQQTGHGIPGAYEITIDGDGNGSYVLNRAGEITKTGVLIAKENLIELLNDFYQIHFFELADTYAVKKQVILQENAMLATVARKMADVSSQRLCIELADYKKCVTIVDNQPVEAARLIKKIEGLFANRKQQGIAPRAVE